MPALRAFWHVSRLVGNDQLAARGNIDLCFLEGKASGQTNVLIVRNQEKTLEWFPSPSGLSITHKSEIRTPTAFFHSAQRLRVCELPWEKAPKEI